jgi:hypothetical protein
MQKNTNPKDWILKLENAKKKSIQENKHSGIEGSKNSK